MVTFAFMLVNKMRAFSRSDPGSDCPGSLSMSIDNIRIYFTFADVVLCLDFFATSFL